MFNSLKSRLNDAADAVLNADDYNYQNTSLVLLFNKLEAMSIMDGYDSENETKIPEGVCLCPQDASNCMLDTIRTVKFVRGLASAIQEAKNRNQGKRITVLYAGCGPFATLALPVSAVFKPEDVGFTVIDIHKESIRNVRRIVRHLGLKKYFDEFICGNALDYPVDNGKKFDIVVTETMTSALLEEPQAAITTHLSKALKPNGLFVPEEIVIGVRMSALNALKYKRDKAAPRNVLLGDIFTLDKDTKAESFTPRLNAELHIPDKLDKQLPYAVILNTRIRIFGEHALREGEASITKPVFIKFPPQTKIGSKLNISYPLGGANTSLDIEFCD